jgi:hypothetical protein
LALFSKDLFVDSAECRGLAGFWVKRGWIRDVSNLAYSKHKGVSDFFRKWGGSKCRGVYRFIPDVRGMPGVLGWPNMNPDMLLIACRDLKFGVSNKGIKGFIPLDEEPGVIDKFKG